MREELSDGASICINLEVVFSGGVVGVAVLQLWGVAVLWGLQCSVAVV